MVAPIKFLSGRQQQQKIGVIGSTEDTKVLEVIGRVGIGTTIFDADYNLDVRGNANISGILTVGQIISGAGNSFSDLYVTGLSTFKSNVDIDASVDISNNLTVDGLSDLDELNVAGIATFGSNIDANAGLDVDGLSDLDELNVAGIATFGSNIDANAGLDVDGLSDLDELNVAGIATFGSDVDINASVDISNNLTVDGLTDLDELNVAGIATFGSNIDANAGLDVDGLSDLDELNVAGIATFGSDVDINASVDISNNLNVDGRTDLEQLNVAGLSTFTFNVDINAAVDISDNLTIGPSGTLSVDGLSDLDELNVAGIATFGSNVDINASVDISTNLTVDGLSDLDELNVAGIATFGSNVDINASVDISNNLNVSGVSTFNDDVTFVGSFQSADLTWDESLSRLSFEDEAQLRFGNNSDLFIYHTNTGSGLPDNWGTGTYILAQHHDLIISAGSSKSVKITRSGYGGALALFDDVDGNVELYYQGGLPGSGNGKKLETTGVGVSIVNGTSDTATIYGPSNLIIDPMPIGVGTTSGIVRIKGDLYVDGTQFVVASSTIELADFVVGIATTVPNDIVLDGAGIGIGTNKTFLYEYNSGTNPSLKSSENLNVASGKHYQIGEVEVLSSTTLGSGVVNSSLTNLGTLTSVQIDNVRIDGNTIDTTSGNLILDSNGGIVDINDNVDISGNVDIEDATQSTNTTTGALKVVGGVGIAKNLNVGGNLDVDGNTELDATNISETLNVTGISTFASNVDINASVDISTDLTVDGHTELDTLNVSIATTTASLTLANAGVAVTAILDEDGLTSNRDDALATQQSIKAYVDNLVDAQDLDFAGDTGTGAVDLDSQTFTIAGTANEIETVGSGVTLTIGLPNDVAITTSLVVGSGVTITGSTVQVGGTITELYNGQFWNVVTQADVGYGASQVPLNQYLGQLAFLDDYHPNGLRRDGGGSDDVFVKSDGFVGIGTTNPTSNLDVRGTLNVTGIATANIFESTVASGTAPFIVASTTQVTNLNANYLNGYASAVTNTANTVVRRDASGDFSAGTITANLTGTATTATNLADGANITTGTISDDRLPDLITSNINIASGISSVATLDATNATIDNLTFTSGTAITSVDTDLATVSGSDDTLASAKAIKAYVDAQNTAQDLDIQGDTGGLLSIDLDDETLTIAGTANEIETVGSGNTITIGLPNDVTISNNLDVGDSITALNSLYLGSLSSPTFTLSENLLQYDSGTFDFSASELKFSIYADGEKARLTSTGLGIGITNPTARLDVVNDTTNDEEVLRVRGYHGNSGSVQGITHIGLGYWTTGTYSPARITVQESTAGSYNANLLFSTRSSSSDAAPTERMRISYDGNIGIGTNNPNRLLTLKSTTPIIGLTDYDSGGEFYIQNSSGSGILNADYFRILTNSSSEVVRISSTGDVGIGTIGPSEKLHVVGNIAINQTTVVGSATASLSTLTETAIHTGLSTSTYRSVEYNIQATQGTNYHVTKILALHNGTTAYHNEYGTIFNNTSVATFNVDVSGGNIRLLGIGATSDQTDYVINFTATKL